MTVRELITILQSLPEPEQLLPVSYLSRGIDWEILGVRICEGEDYPEVYPDGHIVLEATQGERIRRIPESLSPFGE